MTEHLSFSTEQSLTQPPELIFSTAFVEDARAIGITAIRPNVDVMESIVQTVSTEDFTRSVPGAIFIRSVSPNRLGSAKDVYWPFLISHTREDDSMYGQQCFTGGDVFASPNADPVSMHDVGTRLTNAQIAAISQVNINLRMIDNPKHVAEAFTRGVFTTSGKPLPRSHTSPSNSTSMARSLLGKQIRGLEAKSPLVVVTD
jgi:hypothetical protein